MSIPIPPETPDPNIDQPILPPDEPTPEPEPEEDPLPPGPPLPAGDPPSEEPPARAYKPGRLSAPLVTIRCQLAGHRKEALATDRRHRTTVPDVRPKG